MGQTGAGLVYRSKVRLRAGVNWPGLVILSKPLLRAKDLGEPHEASRFLRRNDRAFGSPPYEWVMKAWILR